MPGPVPKRSEERRRRNEDVPIDRVPVGQDAVVIPPADPEWHHIAIDWYESLAKSGQSYYYEASDWATAVYVAHAMSINLMSGRKMSAQLFQSVMAAMTSLLTTEGERRRLRLELTRDDQGEKKESAGVTALNDYRRALGSS